MADNDGVTLEEVQAELEKTRVALKAANAESAGRRKRLEELEAEKSQRDDKDLSEAQKLQKLLDAETARRTQLENDLRSARIRSAVEREAAKLGFENVADAYQLADLSAVEIADDGTVKGFEKSLKALVESGRLPLKSGGDSVGTPKRSNQSRLASPDQKMLENLPPLNF